MQNLEDLIDIKKSPLSRIMSVTNSDEPSNRKFQNNICSTHIGDGFVISVAHNLFQQAQFYYSVDDDFYQTNILPKLTPQEITFLNKKYIVNPTTQKRYFNTPGKDLKKLLQFSIRLVLICASLLYIRMKFANHF